MEKPSWFMIFIITSIVTCLSWQSLQIYALRDRIITLENSIIDKTDAERRLALNEYRIERLEKSRGKD